MPWRWLAQATEEDLKAIYAYLRIHSADRKRGSRLPGTAAVGFEILLGMIELTH